MKSLFGTSLLAAALLSGCGKQPAPPPTATVPVVAPPPAAAPATDASPAPDGPPPEVTPMQQSQAAALTLLVQEFAAQRGRVPADLNELVTAKMILKVPPAPPGMKYVINAQHRQVVIVRNP